MSQIQCAVFKGNTRGIFVDKREYGGNLWDQVEQAYQFVLRNIHLGARIKGIHRQDVYELPPESIRELIINAFVYMNLIEQWGSGIPKILAQTKEYGLPEVEFIDMENALRVNMYRAFSNDEKQTIKANDKR